MFLRYRRLYTRLISSLMFAPRSIFELWRQKSNLHFRSRSGSDAHPPTVHPTESPSAFYPSPARVSVRVDGIQRHLATVLEPRGAPAERAVQSRIMTHVPLTTRHAPRTNPISAEADIPEAASGPAEPIARPEVRSGGTSTLGSHLNHDRLSRCSRRGYQTVGGEVRCLRPGPAPQCTLQDSQVTRLSREASRAPVKQQL